MAVVDLAKQVGTTKGDLYVHNGTTLVRLAVGTNDQVLTADSALAAGVKWAAGGAGGTGTLTELVLPGALFQPTSGSPEAALLASRHRVLAFNATSEEHAAYTGFPLYGWTSVNIDFLWSVGTASPTGNVVWAAVIESYNDTESLNASGTFTSDTTDAVGAQFGLVVTRLATAYAVTDSEDLYNCRAIRRAAAAGDTFSGDAALLAVKVTEA